MEHARYKYGVYLTPRVRLFQTRSSGWYMIDFDLELNGPEITDSEIKEAVEALASYIEIYHPRAATGPARYVEDHFRTAEEALADLKRHRGG